MLIYSPWAVLSGPSWRDGIQIRANQITLSPRWPASMSSRGRGRWRKDIDHKRLNISSTVFNVSLTWNLTLQVFRKLRRADISNTSTRAQGSSSLGRRVVRWYAEHLLDEIIGFFHESFIKCSSKLLTWGWDIRLSTWYKFRNPVGRH